jgi:hypothetical protein
MLNIIFNGFSFCLLMIQLTAAYKEESSLIYFKILSQHSPERNKES